jgi:uridine kinase
MADVIHQYHATVRPMHNVHVEPTKFLADFVVQSTAHSMSVAMEMLVNHVKVKTGMEVADAVDAAIVEEQSRSSEEPVGPAVTYDPVADEFDMVEEVEGR